MSNLRSDYIVIPGRFLFGDHLAPVIPPGGNKLRYAATIQTAKDAPQMGQLFELVESVGRKVWGASADQKIMALQQMIANGTPPTSSQISIRDGDLFNPERNRGFYLIQATRKQADGAPKLYGIDGAEVEGTSPEAPVPGDGVLMLVNVWCMAAYPRMNFTLESIRKAQPGLAIGGGPSPAEREAANELFRQVGVPQSIAGVQPARQVAAQASPTPPPAQVPAGWGASREAAVSTEAPRGSRLVKGL